MHKFLEHYIIGSGYDDLTELGQKAKTMAEKIIDVGLTPVEEWYGSEVTLYYPGLFAGSTDLVCLHNGKETVVDFKQANRPKKEEWIDDYKMQIAAYAMAHDALYKTNIEAGVVLMASRGLTLQTFTLTGDRLDDYKYKWLKRCERYYNE